MFLVILSSVLSLRARTNNKALSSKINPHNLKGVAQFQAMVGGYVAVGSLATGKLDSKNDCE